MGLPRSHASLQYRAYSCGFSLNVTQKCLPAIGWKGLIPRVSVLSSETVYVKIRKAAESDVPVIVDYNLGLAQETEELELDRATVRAGVEAMFRDGDKGRYYVAELDGKVVGQVMITYEWSDWRNGNIWWLQSVYVHPAYRRRGVFAGLFAHVQRLCSAEGGSALRLYMHADNARARACYGRLGMAETKYQVFEKSGL